MKTSFNDFTKRLAYTAAMAREELVKRSNLGELSDVGYNVSHYADDIMVAAEMHKLYQQVVFGHEKICLEYIESGRLGNLMAELNDDKWWDDESRKLLMRLTSQSLRDVYRGASFSSNPMTIVAEMAKVEANKKVLSSLIGYPESFFDPASIADLFDGIDRREAEEEARRLTQVSKVVVRKLAKSGGFFFTTVNHKGEELGRTMLYTASTYKRDAMAEAEHWSAELRVEQSDGKSHGNPYITVEYL